MTNVIWHAAPPPKNKAEVWEWPVAVYAGPQQKPAAYIICREPCSERGMNNGPVVHKLQVMVLDYSHDPAKPHRKICNDREFDRLETAMAFVQAFLATHPLWQPTLV